MEKKEETLFVTKEHCSYCFDILLSIYGLDLNEEIEFPKDIEEVEAPLFVTWKILGHLRGCIGNRT